MTVTDILMVAVTKCAALGLCAQEMLTEWRALEIRAILFWDTSLGSHLIDTVEAQYIDTCTVLGDRVVNKDLGLKALTKHFLSVQH